MTCDVGTIDPDALRAAVSEIFVAVGVPETDATRIAEHLVRAELRGVTSHGVTRVGVYVERLESGLVARKTQHSVARETPVSALLDGQGGSGIVVAQEAMKVAIEKATESGLGAVGVQRSTHCGMLADYTAEAASHGLIGLATTNAPATMAPWGGREGFFGTNPLSYAIPCGAETDIVFDMATSQVSRGKILLAAKEARHIPLGWATGPDGVETTDSAEALAGLVLPLGGPKGSGIAFLVEVLSAILTGAAFGPHVPPLYDNDHTEQNVGHFFLAMRPDLFVSFEEFTSRMAQMVSEIRQVRIAPGVDRIYLPGEIELIEQERRNRDGIPLSPQVSGELVELACRLGTPSAPELENVARQ